MDSEGFIEFKPDSMDAIELHRYLGAVPVSATASSVCVWAPRHSLLNIVNEDSGECHQLHKVAGGYHIGVVQGLSSGARYQVQLESGLRRPDPVSRYQPDGVHGPSSVVASLYPWTDQKWRGVDQEDLIIYELHIGTFTPDGSFASAIDRLDELVTLGVTAIELMPVNQSAGRWNWGYDGVNWFAPQNTYGTPDDLRCLVDTAHSKGLAVILDVVYNHFGPEGNYLHDFGGYVSAKHSSAWGPAPDFDQGVESQQLRRLIIANAVYWLDEFHIDGLRVDAIHCICDDSAVHWVAELSAAVQRWGRLHDRRPLLIAESNVFDSQMLEPLQKGGYEFDALWCDCFLQSVFAVVRPMDQLSVRSYESADLRRVLSQAYIYEGSIGTQRQRTIREDRPDMKGLVYSIQHHDCIGNHPLGKRLHQLTDVETQRAACTLMLLMPAIPMLFMGEEFCSDSAFNFFVDFSDESLRTAVEKGRQAEYPQHDWSDGVSPLNPQAMTGSRIGSIDEGSRDTWNWYRKIIALRKSLRNTGLLDQNNLVTLSDVQAGIYQLRYECGPQSVLLVLRLTSCENKAVSAVQFTPLKNIPGELSYDSSGIKSARLELLPNHAKIFTDPGLIL